MQLTSINIFNILPAGYVIGIMDKRKLFPMTWKVISVLAY